MQNETEPQDTVDMQHDSQTGAAATATTTALDAAEIAAAMPLPLLTSADADRRRASASVRHILQAERTILAAGNKVLKTYVICPGILYGELSYLSLGFMKAFTWLADQLVASPKTS